MDDGPAAALSCFREAYLEFASRFDPRLLEHPERAPAIEILAQVEKSLALMGALTAWLMAAQPVGKYGPPRPSPMRLRLTANRCATAWGVSTDHARRTLAMGERMAAQPEVTKAAFGGELSMAQAALVTGAAQADPEATSYLLATARHRTLGGLASECRRVTARKETADAGLRAGQPDDGGRPSRPERSLRSWVDRQDRWHLAARGTRQDGERIMAAVQMFMPSGWEPVRDTSEDGLDPGLETCLDGLLALAGTVTGVTGVTGAGPTDMADLASLSAKFMKRPRRKRRARTGREEVPRRDGYRPGRFSVEHLDWLFAPTDTSGPGGHGAAEAEPP